MKYIHLKLLIIAYLMLQLSFNCDSQNIRYSQKEHLGYFNYNIIGKVKNNIIICRYNLFNPFNNKSVLEIIIDNPDLQTLKKIKSTILEGGKLEQINFINNTDSFQVVIKYLVKTKVIYKQASFDENGNCLNIHTLLNYKYDVNNDQLYQFVPSSDGKSFALVNTMGNDSLKFLKINYTFVSDGLLHSGSQFFPFDFKNSKIGNAVIDNDNLIFSTSGIANSSFQLSVFKINLETDNAVNTIRPVQDGYLIDNTVTIKPLKNDYVVSANWTNAKKNVSGVFLWKLNKDLSDEITDTVIENNNDSSSVVFNTNNFSVDTYQNFKQTKNLYVFLSNNAFTSSGHYYSPQMNSSYNASSFSSDLSAPMANPSYNTNGVVKGVVYNNALKKVSNYQPYTPNSNNSSYIKPDVMQPEKSKVSILKLNIDNKILNKLTFNASIDKYAISNITSAKVVTGENTFYVVFNQTAKNNLETYSYLKINTANLQYTYNHIISMNLKYKLLLGQGVQINDNTLIVPCFQNEFIAFAKIVFE